MAEVEAPLLTEPPPRLEQLGAAALEAGVARAADRQARAVGVVKHEQHGLEGLLRIMSHNSSGGHADGDLSAASSAAASLSSLDSAALEESLKVAGPAAEQQSNSPNRPQPGATPPVRVRLPASTVRELLQQLESASLAGSPPTPQPSGSNGPAPTSLVGSSMGSFLSAAEGASPDYTPKAAAQALPLDAQAMQQQQQQQVGIGCPGVSSVGAGSAATQAVASMYGCEQLPPAADLVQPSLALMHAVNQGWTLPGLCKPASDAAATSTAAQHPDWADATTATPLTAETARPAVQAPSLLLNTVIGATGGSQPASMSLTVPPAVQPAVQPDNLALLQALLQQQQTQQLLLQQQQLGGHIQQGLGGHIQQGLGYEVPLPGWPGWPPYMQMRPVRRQPMELDPPESLLGIHGRYQSYCQQVISERLNTAATSALTMVKLLQNTDPPLAPRLGWRRYFCSLKEVSKVVPMARCLIVAPDVRQCPTAHINPVRALQRILRDAEACGVPVIFALSRRGIGQVFGRDKMMSIVALMQLEGLEAVYQEMVEEAIKGRQLYMQHRVTPLRR